MAKNTIIRIKSDLRNGTTPLIINGKKKSLPHNEDVTVTADELDALLNSNVRYETVGTTSSKPTLDAEEGPGGSASASYNPVADQKRGGDALRKPAPEAGLSVVTKGPEINQEPGGDNLTHEAVIHGAPADTRDEDALQDARDAAQAAADGTTKPAVILTNDDPDQTGKTAREASENSKAPANAGVKEPVEKPSVKTPTRKRATTSAKKPTK
jgi:hypothetical protein